MEESKLDEAAARDGVDTKSSTSKGSKASLQSNKSNNSEEVGCNYILSAGMVTYVVC